MADVILQTQGLTKRFGSRTAVDKLTLHVERGDIYGFLGPNGAGKSTTLRMLLGLIRPSAGKVEFPNHGVRWDYLRMRSRIGAIIETPAFYENFSARRNLQLLASLSGGVQSKRVEEVLDIVGLKERAREPVKVFSYGMRQRLGIAQALLPTPQLIILDEPTNGLDPQGIQQTRQLIRRLRDELKLTVLLSSHLLAEVEQLCNQSELFTRDVCFMKANRLRSSRPRPGSSSKSIKPRRRFSYSQKIPRLKLAKMALPISTSRLLPNTSVT